MKECIIPMKSPTIASKAERILFAGGIRASIISVDPSVTKHGCGYGLSLFCRDAERAKYILDRRNIPYGDLIGGVSDDLS